MKHKSFEIQEPVFQLYLLAQSQHQRRRNRGKCIINTFVMPSLSIDTLTQTQQ